MSNEAGTHSTHEVARMISEHPATVSTWARTNRIKSVQGKYHGRTIYRIPHEEALRICSLYAGKVRLGDLARTLKQDPQRLHTVYQRPITVEHHYTPGFEHLITERDALRTRKWFEVERAFLDKSVTIEELSERIEKSTSNTHSIIKAFSVPTYLYLGSELRIPKPIADGLAQIYVHQAKRTFRTKLETEVKALIDAFERNHKNGFEANYAKLGIGKIKPEKEFFEEEEYEKLARKEPDELIDFIAQRLHDPRNDDERIFREAYVLSKTRSEVRNYRGIVSRILMAPNVSLSTKLSFLAGFARVYRHLDEHEPQHIQDLLLLSNKYFIRADEGNFSQAIPLLVKIREKPTVTLVKKLVDAFPERR